MVKFVVKLKNCQIGTKIGVVVDMDYPIMTTAVCGKMCGKIYSKIEKLLDWNKGAMGPQSSSF